MTALNRYVVIFFRKLSSLPYILDTQARETQHLDPLFFKHTASVLLNLQKNFNTDKMCCNNYQNLCETLLWHMQLHFWQQILSNATSKWTLSLYIWPSTLIWSRNFHYCTCSHLTVSDPHLHILIFSKQHGHDNLKFYNVIPCRLLWSPAGA